MRTAGAGSIDLTAAFAERTIHASTDHSDRIGIGRDGWPGCSGARRVGGPGPNNARPSARKGRRQLQHAPRRAHPARRLLPRGRWRSGAGAVASVRVCRAQRDQVGFTIIDLHDLKNVKVLYRWRIENMALHAGLGALRPKYFKLNGRYYVALCTQFAQGTPDADLGAIIFDVTGLPDTTKIKEVARIRFPEMPGGFHNLFPYKHSDGRVLLFTTTTGAQANVYDMEKLLHGDKDQALIGTIPVPQGNVRGEVLPGLRARADRCMTGLSRLLHWLRSGHAAGQVLRRGRRRLLRLRCDAHRHGRAQAHHLDRRARPAWRGATRSRRRRTGNTR